MLILKVIFGMSALFALIDKDDSNCRVYSLDSRGKFVLEEISNVSAQVEINYKTVLVLKNDLYSLQRNNNDLKVSGFGTNFVYGGRSVQSHELVPIELSFSNSREVPKYTRSQCRSMCQTKQCRWVCYNIARKHERLKEAYHLMDMSGDIASGNALVGKNCLN